MPTVWRALQAWEKLRPTSTGLPVPMPAIYGLAMELTLRGHSDLTKLTVLVADAYLRPDEAINLTEDMVIPSQASLGTPYSRVSLLLRPWARDRLSNWRLYDDSVLSCWTRPTGLFWDRWPFK